MIPRVHEEGVLVGDVSSPWCLDVFVAGTPVPKGSLKAYAQKAPNTRRGMRAVVTADNGPEQAAWGSAVRGAVLAAWNATNRLSDTGTPLFGPSRCAAVVAVEFIMPRRKGAPKTFTPWHTRKPDSDKLVRLVGDCLTDIIIADDAQVVSWQPHKREAETHETPGARIRVALLVDVTKPESGRDVS